MVVLNTLFAHVDRAAFPLLALMGFASYLLPVGQISFWVATKTFRK